MRALAAFDFAHGSGSVWSVACEHRSKSGQHEMRALAACDFAHGSGSVWSVACEH